MRRAAFSEPKVARLVSLVALASFHSGASVAQAAPAPLATAQLLAELEKDTAHRPVIAAALGKARSALTRARSMDQAGDSRHAAMMRAVAERWLLAARDSRRTAEAEARATRVEQALDEVETKRTRGKALLEETIARRGRARALLEQLERDAKAPPGPDTDTKVPKGGASPGTTPGSQQNLTTSPSEKAPPASE